MSPYVLLSETQWPHELPKEIVAAPVEGWRIWAVYPPTLGPPLSVTRLGSVGIGLNQWDRVEQARCHNQTPLPPRPHSAPFTNCGCGLWAFKDDSQVMEALRTYAVASGVFGFGRVQLWGRIIECEHGWRGEYARPVDVTLLGADEATAEAIREFYGCEVTVEDVPEWLRAERSAYAQMGRGPGQWLWNSTQQQWVSSTPGVNPIPVPLPVPTKRRRSFVGSSLLCLALAVINAVFACLGAFGHNGHWPVNAMAALATFVVFCMYWDLP